MRDLGVYSAADCRMTFSRCGLHRFSETFAKLVVTAWAFLAFAPASLLAQGGAPPPPLDPVANNPLFVTGTSTVEIHILSPSGSALGIDAHIRLVPAEALSTGTNFYEANSRHGFVNVSAVAGGEYTLEVSAPGFETHREKLMVLAGYVTTKAFVKLHAFDGSSDDIELEQPGAPVLPAAARRDLETAVLALKSGKQREAASRVKNALKRAPDNPDVHYVAGYMADQEHDAAGARAEYESAVKLFPNHFASQLGLGEDSLLDHDAAGAITHIEKALAVGPNSWRGHWLLAEACLQEQPRDAQRAKSEASFAVQLGKGRATAALVTIAIADAVAGDRATSRQEVESFLHNYPSARDTSRAKEFLKMLDQADENAAAAQAAVAVPSADLRADLADLESLAPESIPGLPADVDAAVPPVTEGASCELPQVLTGAGVRARELVANLQRFSAKEMVVHDDLDAKGLPRNSAHRSFDYVVELDQARGDVIHVNEMRDGWFTLGNFPAPLAIEGIPALGLLFHPVLAAGFNFTCEGLGNWHGQPAWQVRFEQRGDRPARLNSWMVNDKEYPAVFKGRAWLSSDSYQLLHSEFDLMQPIVPLRLEYQHMAVDYKPVRFSTKKDALWLPSNAAIYCKYRGRYFRQEHDFSDFTLFSTSVQEKTGSSETR
jgi:tetratricopeptide (TPR) repeat protein